MGDHSVVEIGSLFKLLAGCHWDSRHLPKYLHRGSPHRLAESRRGPSGKKSFLCRLMSSFLFPWTLKSESPRLTWKAISFFSVSMACAGVNPWAMTLTHLSG